LGMRESSGNCFEGRDASAGNTSSETAEAGLFQQSHRSSEGAPDTPSRKMLSEIPMTGWPGTTGIRCIAGASAADGRGSHRRPPFPIPLPQPGPAPVPSPPPVIGDFVTAVLTQLISLLKERLMSLQSIGTQPATTAAPTSAQQVEELRKLVEIFGSLITDGKLGPPPLGQVNGALGQTIGNLLNGKKTAIGVIGALATSPHRNS